MGCDYLRHADHDRIIQAKSDSTINSRKRQVEMRRQKL
jgi:hypothetical protein